ncbi:hypothetical protein GQ457_02G021500 [Hibiscus cannabinus]
MENLTETLQSVSLESAQTFSKKKKNVKLDDTTYLMWKQQVLLTLRSHGLEWFLDGSESVLPRFTVTETREHVERPEYRRYVKHDCALASWLLRTVSDHVLPKQVGAETTTTIWSQLMSIYSKKSITRVMHLHCQLRAVKKGDLSMRDYLTQVKHICDSLAASGSSVTEVEQIATMLMD